MSPWTERHRPKSFLEIKGQEEAIKKIKNFITSFNITNLAGSKNQKKALLLYGPPGIGKTTLAYVASNETNSEIFELNASDFRDKNRLQEILKPVLQQKSLIKKSKIILVDEADGIMGTDRGGVPELVKLIQNSKYPLIITANDAWTKKLAPLRKLCELVQLQEIDYQEIKRTLIDILKIEKKFINNEILTQIAKKSRGDLRAAINDLQTISKLEDPSKISFDERNKELDIFKALQKIFKSKPEKETSRIFDEVKMPLDEIMLWVEENIPKEYSGIELAKAVESLSKADIFKGRIYKQQYWRFMLYENILLSYGISASKDLSKPRTNFTKYKRPSRILKIWMNNQKTAKKKSIAQKYAQAVHISIKRAMKEFPLIKQIINSNPKIKEELKLNEEEINYLVK